MKSISCIFIVRKERSVKDLINTHDVFGLHLGNRKAKKYANLLHLYHSLCFLPFLPFNILF